MVKSHTELNFYHQNADLFEAAIQYTAEETGFFASLIEKDYFCSLILKELFNNTEHNLIFKGGTLLNKVHVGFYRLSEDLDFSISVKPGLTRKDRSILMQPVKSLVSQLSSKIPGIKIIEPLKGSNGSAQYNASFEYESCIAQNETISFEIGLREEVLMPIANLGARTILQSSINNDFAYKPFQVSCLHKFEAYAEKVRAALTRRIPAIRDIFDLDYAIRKDILDIENLEFLDLVRTKLTKPQAVKIDLSETKKSQLLSQIEADLIPVLRPVDFEDFDFEMAWESLVRLGDRLESL